jgi:hypothetical protein
MRVNQVIGIVVVRLYLHGLQRSCRYRVKTMKTSTQVERRIARAMKRAIHEGCDPRNTAPKQGHVYKRLWRDDMSKHVHRFDDSQTCECGAFFF